MLKTWTIGCYWRKDLFLNTDVGNLQRSASSLKSVEVSSSSTSFSLFSLGCSWWTTRDYFGSSHCWWTWAKRGNNMSYKANLFQTSLKSFYALFFVQIFILANKLLKACLNFFRDKIYQSQNRLGLTDCSNAIKFPSKTQR